MTAVPAADRVVASTDNAPPNPRDAHALNIESLCGEALHWLNGDAIENDRQAEAVQKLMRLLQDASSAADDQRKVEKLPHDDAIAEIQGFWNPLIAPATNKGVKGKASLAIQACQNALTAWLRAQEVERQRLATAARIEAERIAQEARDALAAANASSDLGARDEAEAVVNLARQAQATATQIERDKPTVAGIGRAAGLRDNWVVKGFVPVDNPEGDPTPGDTAAFRFYWATNRQGLQLALLELARQDVRAGKRQIPGILIANEPRV
jgi:hypothetical protein